MQGGHRTVSDVGAELRHSGLLKDMLTAVKANTFKRLTHRFQGGQKGLPKETSHKKVVAAVTKIIADNDTGKTAKKEAKKVAKAEKKAATARAAAAMAEAESSDDDSGTDEEGPLTPVVLTTATRVARTPGYVLPWPNPREQRQSCSGNATGTVRSNAVVTEAAEEALRGWQLMAATGARLARMRATLLGATARRARACVQQGARSTLQALVTGCAARQAAKLQASMAAWRQRCAEAEARSQLRAVLTSARVRQAVRVLQDRESRDATLQQAAALQRKLHGEGTTPALKARGVRRFRALARLAALRVLRKTHSVDVKLGLPSFTRAMVPGGSSAATRSFQLQGRHWM